MRHLAIGHKCSHCTSVAVVIGHSQIHLIAILQTAALNSTNLKVNSHLALKIPRNFRRGDGMDRNLLSQTSAHAKRLRIPGVGSAIGYAFGHTRVQQSPYCSWRSGVASHRRAPCPRCGRGPGLPAGARGATPSARGRAAGGSACAAAARAGLGTGAALAARPGPRTARRRARITDMQPNAEAILCEPFWPSAPGSILKESKGANLFISRSTLTT